ncbi:Kinesin-like protein KIN-14G [Orobanche hederae]
MTILSGHCSDSVLGKRKDTGPCRSQFAEIMEHMLSNVMEEIERRLASQNERVEVTLGVCYVKGHKHNNARREMLREYNTKRDMLRRGILKNLLHAAKEDMQLLRIKYQEEVDNHLSTMAHAASGYQKVIEENRKLYNQVQDLKGNIRVYCRVRPFLPGQANGSSAVEDVSDNTITIITPSKVGKGKKSFTFNKCFGPCSSQEEVFADTQPLIRSVVDGYNVCIFAYGQTRSGKTFTMTGPKELTKETLGVNYWALSDLFLISEQRKDIIAYDISVQMMEIYTEQVRDLLAVDGGDNDSCVMYHVQ